jgi:tRNA (mo5U34)-methyltransferase
MEPSLADRVAEFPRWHYEFDLGDGVVTPIFDRDDVNRHKQRAEYFFEPLVRDCCGGSLAGKRVLDLGCNAGYWSLKALDAGADFVLGIDGRQMHIDQAGLVMEAKGVDPARYRFEQVNVFDWEPNEQFDVVLCLGLLYHVSRPVELLERCSRWNSDLLVLDTKISRIPGNALELRHENTSDPRASVESELVMRPTRRAVIDLCQSAGYLQTAVLKPRFSSWQGSRDFRVGLRRAFIAAKHTQLTGLDEEHLRSPIVDDLSTWAFLAAWARRHRLRRIAKRLSRL